MFKGIMSNKRKLYLATLSVLILLCVVLNTSFSAFTQSTDRKAVNITVGTLSYGIEIDGVNTDIITATNNNVTKTNIELTNINALDTKYEIIYKVYSDSTCLEEVNELPEGFGIEYSSLSEDEITGSILSNESKNIRLVITNDTNDTYYIKLGVNSGFIYNTLQTTNQIDNEYLEAVECPSGTYLLANEKTCTECPAGSYCVGGSYNQSENEQGKTLCPAGSYQDETGQIVCKVCENGKTSSEGATSSCTTDCTNTTGVNSWLTPTWETSSVSNSCTANTCNANYYKNGSSCTACNGGQTTSGNNTSTSCTACSSTGVNAWAGAGQGCAVSKCNANYYKNGSSCSACPAGQYTSAGNTSTGCTACSSTGVNAWAGAGQGCAVSKCSTNYYKNGSSCSACAGGKYTSNANTSTSCSNCTNSANVASWSGSAQGCSIKSCNSGYKISNNACVSNSCTVYCTSTSSCSKTKPSSGLYGVFTCSSGKTGSISQCWYGSTKCNGAHGYGATYVCTYTAGSINSLYYCDDSFSYGVYIYGLGLSGSGYSCSC